MHNVVALVVPDVIIFDLAIPAEIFGRAVERERYGFVVCTEHPGVVQSTSGFNLEIGSGLDAIEVADTVIVPGFFPRDAPSPVVIAALRRASERGARVASVCVGAFALAAAGLLDGRSATTHWEFADELAARFPAVRVTPEVLYVDEGPVLTSAGIAAGVDLCLYMIRSDYGAVAATRSVATHGRADAPCRRPGSVHGATCSRRRTRSGADPRLGDTGDVSPPDRRRARRARRLLDPDPSHGDSSPRSARHRCDG